MDLDICSHAPLKLKLNDCTLFLSRIIPADFISHMDPQAASVTSTTDVVNNAETFISVSTPYTLCLRASPLVSLSHCCQEKQVGTLLSLLPWISYGICWYSRWEGGHDDDDNDLSDATCLKLCINAFYDICWTCQSCVSMLQENQSATGTKKAESLNLELELEQWTGLVIRLHKRNYSQWHDRLTPLLPFNPPQREDKKQST